MHAMEMLMQSMTLFAIQILVSHLLEALSIMEVYYTLMKLVNKIVLVD